MFVESSLFENKPTIYLHFATPHFANRSLTRTDKNLETREPLPMLFGAPPGLPDFPGHLIT